MNNKRLTRKPDRMIAGVCSGLADFFGFQVETVRVVYLLLTLFTAFSGVGIYLILWLIMPEDRGQS